MPSGLLVAIRWPRDRAQDHRGVDQVVATRDTQELPSGTGFMVVQTDDVTRVRSEEPGKVGLAPPISPHLAEGAGGNAQPFAALPGASHEHGRPTPAVLFVAMGMLGFGVGSFFAAMPCVIFAVTPKSETSSATSFNYVVRNVGYSLGGAIGGVVLAAGREAIIAVRNEALDKQRTVDVPDTAQHNLLAWTYAQESRVGSPPG
jgi:hypothetical protein